MSAQQKVFLVFLLSLAFVTQGVAVGQSQLAVSFLDVGQAEATLLQADGVTILIDAGDHLRDDLLPHLKRLGVEEIDLLVLTHPHADHIGQAVDVLKAYPIKEVWMSGYVHTTKTFEDLIDALLASPAAYFEPRRGDQINFGKLTLEVLNPTEPLSGSMHATCLVLRATYGQVAFLFTADIEKGTEQEILEANLPLKAQILQIAHHGSRTSSSLEFIMAVDPRIAVYSAGAANPFEHPHPEVVERFIRLGCELYGTDTHGTLTVRTDGESLEITTAEEGEGPRGSWGVDLNRAGWEELQRIIHIGPARAGEIIKLRAIRPFSGLADLARVPGLGPQRIADIKAQGIAYVGE